MCTCRHLQRRGSGPAHHARPGQADAGPLEGGSRHRYLRCVIWPLLIPSVADAMRAQESGMGQVLGALNASI